MTHIFVSKLAIIGPNNGLSPGRRQAIIWTNTEILLTGPLGTNFSEILIGIPTFSFKKMQLKMSSAKWRPFCLGLNELTSGHLVDSRMSPTNRLHISTTGIYTWHSRYLVIFSGLTLGLRPANERRRYFVTTSLVGWVQAWNQPCVLYVMIICNLKITTCVTLCWITWTSCKVDDPKQYGISIFLCGYLIGKKIVKPDGVYINITINPRKIAILFVANFNAINPIGTHMCVSEMFGAKPLPDPMHADS